MTGKYVALEGVDGAGTTTLASALAQELGAILTREPYDELWTGVAVREALVSDTGPWTDALLFMADRAEHLDRVVDPALEAGMTVVSDRSHFSTYAYQAERVPLDDPEHWFDMCYGPWNTEPDIVLWLDAEPEKALERIEPEEKYEKLEFLQAVQSRYEKMNNMYDTFTRIDAEQSEEQVLTDAMEALR